MLDIEINQRNPEEDRWEFIEMKVIDCNEAEGLTTCVEALFLGKWCILGEVK